MSVVVGEYHDEGPDKYLIRVPNGDFSGRREGAVFVEGVALIKDLRLARKFSNYYGYRVVLPRGADTKNWESHVEEEEDESDDNPNVAPTSGFASASSEDDDTGDDDEAEWEQMKASAAALNEEEDE